MMKPTYNTGLYERLSRDDELQGESNSISTQRMMLRRYADEHHTLGGYTVAFPLQFIITGQPFI